MPRKSNGSDESAPRVEFTPKEKGSITRKFHAELKETNKAKAHYAASKRGHKFTLDYNPLAESKRICWSVCVNRRWVSGNSGTLFDALESIAQKIANKELDKRLAAEEEA